MTKLEQLKMVMSANRAKLSFVSSEEAYAQQDRALRGMTMERSSGGLFKKAVQNAEAAPLPTLE